MMSLNNSRLDDLVKDNTLQQNKRQIERVGIALLHKKEWPT